MMMAGVDSSPSSQPSVERVAFFANAAGFSPVMLFGSPVPVLADAFRAAAFLAAAPERAHQDLLDDLSEFNGQVLFAKCCDLVSASVSILRITPWH